MRTETLTLIHIGRARIFHDKVIFFTWAAPQVTRMGDVLRKRVLTIITYLTLKLLYKSIYMIAV